MKVGVLIVLCCLVLFVLGVLVGMNLPQQGRYQYFPPSGTDYVHTVFDTRTGKLYSVSAFGHGVTDPMTGKSEGESLDTPSKGKGEGTQ